MIRMKLTKLHLSSISLYSASSVCIPSSVNNFRDMLPTIRLSPLGSPIIKKYTKPFKGRDSVPPGRESITCMRWSLGVVGGA